MRACLNGFVSLEDKTYPSAVSLRGGSQISKIDTVYFEICGDSASGDISIYSQWIDDPNLPLNEHIKHRRNQTFYKCLSDRTLTFKDEKCHRGKLSKDRSTVGTSTNCGELTFEDYSQVDDDISVYVPNRCRNIGFGPSRRGRRRRRATANSSHIGRDKAISYYPTLLRPQNRHKWRFLHSFFIVGIPQSTSLRPASAGQLSEVLILRARRPDVVVRLALHARPHPAHLAFTRDFCIARGSGDLSLTHRYWCCSPGKSLITYSGLRTCRNGSSGLAFKTSTSP
ncbi:hypothetical protein LAZ67_1001600 [Cordylochernes scorpioides]|uniref:Uncharacterized protein n=1 Tax=Cordylochernes scorpioides TaxID=51811 RepID=A0ABY6JVU9_9ARAC|nr:hypothetical protein LAZ67_1001600 [Cordylochernes scorpioides]